MSKQHHRYNVEDVKTILVGVDLTVESKPLVEEGARLAKKWGAKLVLAHVVPIDPYIEINFATTLPWEGARADKEREIRDFYGVKGEVEIRFGRADDEIVQLTKKFDNPLILVGHSTKAWIEKLFMGSTSKSLATRYDKPVLIV